MKASLSLQFAIAASVAASAVRLNPKLSADDARTAHPEDDRDLVSLIESLRSHLPSAGSIASVYDDSVDFMSSVLESAVHTAEDVQDQIYSSLESAVDTVRDAADEIQAGGGRDFPDHTIYQLISFSEHTKKFAKIVDEYPDVVKVLNSTKANHTLFVPVDEAFEHIPEGHKPSKEFVESLLKYHIGLGDYPAYRILTTHTLPTILDEELLGGEPQRLRTSVSFTGVRVNFYSKVIAADIKAKNGVVHAVRSILVPPPFLGRILTLFPSKFSTLLLAYEKTDFVKFIHKVPLVGSTIFAPTNNAFAWLGPKVNAFLFNTETGLKYLDALLKYQITANTTLYSDAFYDNTGSKGEDSDAETLGTEHFDLTTLLKGAHVGVDIASWGGFRTIRVNGFSHVAISDGIGKNGVIQVVDKVLIPPRKHKEADVAFDWDGYEITVDELVSRLDEYLDEPTNEAELEWEL